MVIAKTDIKIMYSGTATKNGPGGPQGGVISSFALPEQNLSTGINIGNTVFEDVTDVQARNGAKHYVCLYIKNAHPSQTAKRVKLWQSALTPGRDKIRIGYSGAPINTHDPLQTESLTKIYEVAPTTSQSRMDHDRERAGVYISNSSSVLTQKPIVKVEWYLLRVGNPTGTLSVKHRTWKSETVLTDFGSIDVSTINNSTPTLYPFEAAGNSRKMKVEDIIACEYENGTEDDFIALMRMANGPFKYSHVVNYDGRQWRNVSSFDPSGNIYFAGTSGDTSAPNGVTFENPVNADTAIEFPDLPAAAFVPFWLRREVPANSSFQRDNTSELAIWFRSPGT